MDWFMSTEAAFTVNQYTAQSGHQKHFKDFFIKNSCRSEQRRSVVLWNAELFFFFLLFLLSFLSWFVDRTGSTRSWAQFTQGGKVGVVLTRLWCRPASGRKDSAGGGAKKIRDGWTLDVFVCGASNVCGSHQAAGWFRTFDSWPASVMVIWFLSVYWRDTVAAHTPRDRRPTGSSSRISSKTCSRSKASNWSVGLRVLEVDYSNHLVCRDTWWRNAVTSQNPPPPDHHHHHHPSPSKPSFQQKDFQPNSDAVNLKSSSVCAITLFSFSDHSSDEKHKFVNCTKVHVEHFLKFYNRTRHLRNLYHKVTKLKSVFVIHHLDSSVFVFVIYRPFSWGSSFSWHASNPLQAKH